MKKSTLITLVLILLAIVCTNCERVSTKSPFIEGLTIDNFPVIDGSTSTLPLSTVIACELMGLDYRWEQEDSNEKTSSWFMAPQIKGSLKNKFSRVVKSSQTHNSFINLINKEADLVLTARTMSSDEKVHAESKGVTLIETPIALDAFIFIVNPSNPVPGLTTKEIQDIYTGKINDWKELGWESTSESLTINPLVRNRNSGSQELMDLLIMKDIGYLDLPVYKENLKFTMAGILDEIASYPPYSIGFTIFYYNEFIIRPGNMLKSISVDGVYPSTRTISNRTYPYVTEVYAVIRSDTDISSNTYKIYEWLQTEAGKQAISKSGYLAN